MEPDQCGTGEFGEWWAGMPGLYEGDSTEGTEPHNRKEEQGTKTTNAEGRGFERWRAARQAAPMTDDELYAAAVAEMTGQNAQRVAGIPTTGLDDPGRADLSEDSDDAEYERYLEVLTGRAARRRASAMAVEHAGDVDEKFLQDARLLGHPLPAHLEDRRGELSEHGY